MSFALCGAGGCELEVGRHRPVLNADSGYCGFGDLLQVCLGVDSPTFAARYRCLCLCDGAQNPDALAFTFFPKGQRLTNGLFCIDHSSGCDGLPDEAFLILAELNVHCFQLPNKLPETRRVCPGVRRAFAQRQIRGENRTTIMLWRS